MMHPLVIHIHLPTVWAPTRILSKPLSEYLNKNQHQKASQKKLYGRRIMMYQTAPHTQAHTPRPAFFLKTRSFFTFVYCCDYPSPQPPWPRRRFAEESCGRWAVLRHQHGIQRLSSHAALTSGPAAVVAKGRKIWLRRHLPFFWGGKRMGDS